MTNDETLLYYDSNPAARVVVLVSVCVGAFLTAATLSATLVAVPAIVGDLRANAVLAAWIPASFVLVNLVTLLPAGRLADLYGRKRMYLQGLTVFIISSLCAGISPSIEFLLLSRGLQGLGAAMFFGPCLALVSSVFRNHGRGAALGWVISLVYFGLTLGPLLGGWIVDTFDWRYVFLSLIPPAIVALILSLVFMKGEWFGENAERVDWVGAALFTLGTGLLFVGVTHLPDLDALLLVVTGLAVFALLSKQMQASKNPLVRVGQVIRNRVFSNSMLSAIFLYGGNFSTIFILGLYLQYNRGLSATEAGQMLMLQTLVMAVVAPVSGRLSDRYNPRMLATCGCVAVACGIALVHALNGSQSLAGIGAGLMVIGVGFGIFSTPNNNMALGSVPESKLGIVSAMLNLARLTGQMLGTTAVTLLIAVFIGKKAITEVQFEGLQRVLDWMLVLAFIFASVSARFASRAKPSEGESKRV